MTRRRPHFPADREGILRIGALLALAGVGVGAWALASARQARRVSKRRPDMPALAGGHGSHVERTVTILRSPADLYAQWRDLERLPALMPHLDSVTLLGDTRSHWVARGPGGTRPAWEAEIVADEPGRLISWRSVGEGDVENAGSVRFTPAPGDRGTEVKVILTYAPPAGRLGLGLATLLGRSADQEVREDLRRFKQRMEAHEVATGAASRRTAAPRELVRSA